ncbi:MAG: hypothetical protein DRO67_03520 [Candidatus Asgardarchaeum californiense]|nr:MAG: hypothetical protein DRO67_03520 [Candidatus Asgardarchaeum californiense]
MNMMQKETENYVKISIFDLIPDKMSVKLPNQREFILKVLRSMPLSGNDFVFMPQEKFQQLIDDYINRLFPDSIGKDITYRFHLLSTHTGLPYRKVERYYYSAFKTPKRLGRLLLSRAIELTGLSKEELAKYAEIQNGRYVYIDQKTFQSLIDKRIEREFPNLSKRQALKRIAEQARLSLNTVILYYYQYFKEQKQKYIRGIRFEVASKLTGLSIEELAKIGKVTLNMKSRAKILAEHLGVSEETIILFWLRDEKSVSFSHITYGAFKKCCEFMNMDIQDMWDKIEIGLGNKFTKLPLYYVLDENLAELCGMFFLTKIHGGHLVLTNTNIQVHKLGINRLLKLGIKPQKMNLYLHIPPAYLDKISIDEVKKKWSEELNIPLDSISIVTRGLHYTKKIAGQLVIYFTPEAYIISNLIEKCPKYLKKSPISVKKAFLRGYVDIKGTVSQSVVVLTIGKENKKTKFIHNLLTELGYTNKIVINRHRISGELVFGQKNVLSSRTLYCTIDFVRENDALKLYISSIHNLTKNPYPVDYLILEGFDGDEKVFSEKYTIDDTEATITIPYKSGYEHLKWVAQIFKIMQYQIRLTKDSSIKFIQNIEINNVEFKEKIELALEGKLLTKISYHILELIKENQNTTSKEIAEKLGKHVVYIRQRLISLVRNGLVTISNTKPYHYALTNKGLELLKSIEKEKI